MVKDLRLQERIRFVGTVPFAQLFDWLHGATALVQPSAVAPDGDAEGAPMVLMHAQAAGVPCVTTRHSGNPEVLPPEGQAFVVPEHDPSALADAMRRMTEVGADARRSLQQAGRTWIEQCYSIDQTIAAYDALYRRLMR
jgi:glycosyltransferase involved in cell wall biosynthesis